MDAQKQPQTTASRIRRAMEKDLQDAYDGSYYTILGAANPEEYVKGYEELLADLQIGRPDFWLQANGNDIDAFAENLRTRVILRPRDVIPVTLTVLLFPLKGLEGPKLAMFKLRMEDRWFDDLVDNMRREARAI